MDKTNLENGIVDGEGVDQGDKNSNALDDAVLFNSVSSSHASPGRAMIARIFENVDGGNVLTKVAECEHILLRARRGEEPSSSINESLMSTSRSSIFEPMVFFKRSKLYDGVLSVTKAVEQIIVQPASKTRDYIKKMLTPNTDDSNLLLTEMKLSLKCPLGQSRIRVPCRAKTCTHIACFEAELYLKLADSSNRWQCPICLKPAAYGNLIIDDYVLEVLESQDLQPDDNEIELLGNGLWKRVEAAQSAPSVVIDLT